MTPDKLPAPRLCTATEPTMCGKMGNAWLLDLKTAGLRRGIVDDPRDAVTLPSWIVQAAYAHPMWSFYLITAVALRDVPGVPKAHVNLAGATHEIMVMALDPDHAPYVDAAPRMLRPVNFIGQFIEPDDRSAAARVQQAVQDVIDGTLNPDTDYRGAWVNRFSGSNLKPGALDPDFIAVKAGAGMVVHGMGAANVRNLQEIVTTAATLKADETKPQ